METTTEREPVRSGVRILSGAVGSFRRVSALTTWLVKPTSVKPQANCGVLGRHHELHHSPLF